MFEAEQLNLFDDSFSRTIEPCDLENCLNEIISAVCKKQEVDSKYIHCNQITNGFSVWICEPTSEKETVRVFNITCKNTSKTKRYEVSVIHKKINSIPIPLDAKVIIKDERHKDENNDVYTVKKTTVIFPLNSKTIYDYLTQFFNNELKKFEPSEKFGCCGKYIECSDSKKCLHKENFYARACYYRKNLESGRIFYGENANT